ncbi:hypothetical protein Hypma_002307 [Hypsizygus marmoreus]|uniref:Uncharacterized protein n=1 Tax=Hypsizygus marmoreus TaxID=39966 RepID=A0A369K5B6_HYPMA|nr:hypothetical protein Hypma_002307 [Hypsizygus marmoreus]
MTPEETLFLRKIGLTLDNGVAWVITLAIFHGAFTLLFGMSTVSIIRQGIQRRPQLNMFIVTTLSFTIATLYLGAQIAAMSTTVHTFLISNVDPPLPAKVDRYRWKVFPLNLIIVWANELVPIFSDAVIIWRSWVIFERQKRAMIGPLVLWLGTIATAFAYLGLSSSYEGVQNLNTSSVQQYLFTANIALSLATNATATMLIGYRLWMHRKSVAGILGPTTTVLNILVILVESGVLYCLLQLVTLIMSIAPDGGTGGVPGSAEWVAAQIFSAAYFEISAMYAVVIIVLVNARRSITDTYGLSNVEDQLGRLTGIEAGPGTLGRLSFVAPVPQSLTLSLSSSRSMSDDPPSVRKPSGDGMWGNGSEVRRDRTTRSSPK